RDLQKWIMGYVNTNEKSGHAARAERPFRNAKIMVEPVPGQAGAYQAVAYLQPWLQMESLTASLRTVARIPEGS
ncbi:MAG TPA: type VI secretion system contractile sheath large subunit, partial [Gammaproteobacteria bacterium]|nr:type VI secretion system contractile sheath large subunit [Gammaproteobacteria bacterium]